SAAEHGMNASTFTARVIASTGADVAAALSGAIGAMSGPLHGGANQAVLEMLSKIRDGDDDVATFVKKVKNREDNVKLMG
ncbi:citrate (Si)-synthase, partial [Mycobacterium sp. ITM-2017-0098]